jgi:hypothetical protein
VSLARAHRAAGAHRRRALEWRSTGRSSTVRGARRGCGGADGGAEGGVLAGIPSANGIGLDDALLIAVTEVTAPACSGRGELGA